MCLSSLNLIEILIEAPVDVVFLITTDIFALLFHCVILITGISKEF